MIVDLQLLCCALPERGQSRERGLLGREGFPWQGRRSAQAHQRAPRLGPPASPRSLL